jgi:hypothetical protein
MEQEKKEELMNCSTLDELLDVEYGEKGTESREHKEDIQITFPTPSPHKNSPHLYFDL